MKHIFLIASIFVAFSCNKQPVSPDEPVVPNEREDTPDIKQINFLQLSATKSVVAPFENTEICIEYNQTAEFPGFDSVVWKLAEGMCVSKNGLNYRHIGWNHYLPGIYEASALGYKDGKMLNSDTVSIEVVPPKGDFFTIKWYDKEHVNYQYGFDESFFLQLLTVSDVNTFAVLYYSVSMSAATYEAYKANTRTFLHDYITETYGESKFSYEKGDVSQSVLQAEYEKRFVNNPSHVNILFNGYLMRNDRIPLEIWDTPRSHIVLMGSAEMPDWFMVFAEPRKF